MAIVRYVSDEEKEEIVQQAVDALYRGAPEEEIAGIRDKLPVIPSLAKSLKDSIGLEGLLGTNLNFYDAVQEYGEDFLKS